MEAARAANAAGGTVIHAKGTGMQKAEQFLGFSLATEKEMILIVVKNCDKNAIMKAIMEKAGAGKQGKVDRFFASSDGNRRNAAGGRRIKETLNLPWIVSLHRKMVWVLYDIFTKEN